jgi:hypothetical protein
MVPKWEDLFTSKGYTPWSFGISALGSVHAQNLSFERTYTQNIPVHKRLLEKYGLPRLSLFHL